MEISRSAAVSKSSRSMLENASVWILSGVLRLVGGTDTTALRGIAQVWQI